MVNDIPGLVNDIPGLVNDGKIDNLFLQCDIRKDGQKRVSDQDPCCCVEECNFILLCQLIFIVYFSLIFEVSDKKRICNEYILRDLGISSYC